MDVDSVEQEIPGFFALSVKANGLDSNGNRAMRGETIIRDKVDNFTFTFDFEYGRPVFSKDKVPSSAKQEQELFIVLETSKFKELVYHKTNTNSGRNFTYEGKEKRSSLVVKVNYQGGSLPITATLPAESIRNAMRGAYNIFVYRKISETESEIIGVGKTFLT